MNDVPYMLVDKVIDGQTVKVKVYPAGVSGVGTPKKKKK